MPKEICIIGAGIIGMTMAYHLLKDNQKVTSPALFFNTKHDKIFNQDKINVTILTKDDPLNTNSDVAAALWRPHDANPIDKAEQWSQETYEVLFDIYYEYLIEQAKLSSMTLSNPGISFITDVKYLADDTKPTWMQNADGMLEKIINRLNEDLKSANQTTVQVAQQLLIKLTKQKELAQTKEKELHCSPENRKFVYASVVPLIDSTFYRP